MSINIYCDGGARGNPGPAACAYIVTDGAGNIRKKCGKYLGKATNNQAEYAAVVEALSWVRAQLPQDKLEVNLFLDSNLVVNQLKGHFKVKNPTLAGAHDQVKAIEIDLNSDFRVKVIYNYIPREENSTADLIVNQTLDSCSYS